MSRLSEMLRLYLAVSKIEVRQLARELGVSPSTVSRLQNGKDVNTDHFVRLLSWLLEEPDNNRKEPLAKGADL